MSVVSAKHRLVDVANVHAHLVITVAEVELGKEHCTLEFAQQLVDDGDREHVADGLRVEHAVVDADVLGSIFLADEEDGRRERECIQANDALLEHVRTLSLDRVLEKLGVAVWPHGHQRCSGEQGNLVVQPALTRELHEILKDVGKLSEER